MIVVMGDHLQQGLPELPFWVVMGGCCGSNFQGNARYRRRLSAILEFCRLIVRVLLAIGFIVR